MVSPQSAAGTKQLENHLELSCISKKHIKTATHTWTIQKFLDRLESGDPFEEEASKLEDIVKSDPFFVPIKLTRGKERRIKFQLELELNNDDRHFPYIGFIVRCLTPEPLFNARLKVHFKHAEEFAGQLNPQMIGHFSKKQCEWGRHTAIEKDLFFTKSDTVLREGSLVLVTKLEVECQHSQNEAVVLPTKPVQGYLGKRLWDSRDKTGDVTLSCGDVDFKAHRVVLMASSDVLEAMFYHEDTSESQTGIVQVKDLSPTCMEELLHYIYFNRLFQNIKPTEEVKDLLIAADKYNIIDLKTLCEHKLISILSKCNVGDIGRFANKYSANHLREHIVHYVVNNYQELAENPEGQWDILPSDIIKDALALMAK